MTRTHYTQLRAEIDRKRPRQPPASSAAEQALLGALLISNRAYQEVADIVRPDDFAWPAHQRIFAAMGKLIGVGQEANPISLSHLFGSDAAFPDAGPAKYLAELAVSAVTLLNSIDYALIIADLSLRRSLIAELEDPQPGETLVDILNACKPRIKALAEAAARLREGVDAR